MVQHKDTPTIKGCNNNVYDFQLVFCSNFCH